MKLLLDRAAWDELLHFQQHEPKVAARLAELINECLRTPFTGTGKPEPLKGDWAGWWSRRITAEHRLVYRVTGKDDSQRLEIAQCRYHY